MLSVVEKKKGTAYASRSDIVKYAGKTGTADIVGYKPEHPDYIMPMRGSRALPHTTIRVWR